MKKFEELGFEERKYVVAEFANWLGKYTHEVVVKVMERFDEIYNNEFAMKLIDELYIRTLKEQEELENSFEYLASDFETFKQYDVHNHSTTYANSYRNVLYDLYIREIVIEK